MASCQCAEMSRVLFVEDVEDTLESLRLGYLTATPDFEASFARNATDALGMYQQARCEFAPFDVIVSDIAMAQDTGLSMAKLIRAGGDNDVKFIFCTGYDGEVNRREAKKVNADRFLVKPVTPIEMFGHVAEVLSQTNSPRRRAGERE